MTTAATGADWARRGTWICAVSGESDCRRQWRSHSNPHRLRFEVVVFSSR
jgi:hypothetical protein